MDHKFAGLVVFPRNSSTRGSRCGAAENFRHDGPRKPLTASGVPNGNSSYVEAVDRGRSAAASREVGPWAEAGIEGILARREPRLVDHLEPVCGSCELCGTTTTAAKLNRWWTTGRLRITSFSSRTRTTKGRSSMLLSSTKPIGWAPMWRLLLFRKHINIIVLTLPPFESTGLLPAGVHPAWPLFVDRFGTRFVGGSSLRSSKLPCACCAMLDVRASLWVAVS